MPMPIPKISIDDSAARGGGGPDFGNSLGSNLGGIRNRRHSFSLFSSDDSSSGGSSGGISPSIQKRDDEHPALLSAFSSFSFVGKSMENIAAASAAANGGDSNSLSANIFQKGSAKCASSKDLMDTALLSSSSCITRPGGGGAGGFDQQGLLKSLDLDKRRLQNTQQTMLLAPSQQQQQSKKQQQQSALLNPSMFGATLTADAINAMTSNSFDKFELVKRKF